MCVCVCFSRIDVLGQCVVPGEGDMMECLFAELRLSGPEAEKITDTALSLKKHTGQFTH